MPDFYSAYRDRLTTARAAVATIPNGARICMALGVAQPPALLEALAHRAAEGKIDGASLFYLLSTATAGQSVLKRGLNGRLRPISLFHSAVERELDDLAAQDGGDPIDLIPTAFSKAPRLLCEDVSVDTLIIQVAPMDAHGDFNLGTNVDYALGVARSAKRVIVEVNRQMPRTCGESTIPLSAVTAVIEHDSPLIEVPSVPRRPEDDAIGTIIAGLVADGACLQMGIGAVPEAVCDALGGHRHLGIHTELMTPGLAALMQKGDRGHQAAERRRHPPQESARRLCRCDRLEP